MYLYCVWASCVLIRNPFLLFTPLLFAELIISEKTLTDSVENKKSSALNSKNDK